MDRPDDRSPLAFDSKRRSTSAKLVLSCVKKQDGKLKLYGVGNLELGGALGKLPELFFHDNCTIVKAEKKIRVVRLPLWIGQTRVPVYVKQHNNLSPWHRLVSLVCASPARRSISSAAKLRKEGIATARPIAAVEFRRWGLLIKSFYVSEEIPQAKTIADYWREDLLPLIGLEGRTKRRATLRSLAGLFKALHERGIYHNDLKASNIIAVDRGPTSDEIFSLIDLQGVRKCFYLSKRRRIKNLAQINRTLGRQLSRTEKLFFIKAYLGDSIVDRMEKRQLLRSILKVTHRQIIRERARHLTTEGVPSRDGISETGELAADEYARSKALSVSRV